MPNLTHAAFGKTVGLSRSRISQLVAQGMPVGGDGRIDEDAGKAWIAANLDPDRRRGAKPAAAPDAKLAGAQASVAALRSQKLFREAVLLDLEVKKRQGVLIDRGEVERTVFARARMERDAWLGFASRATAALAAEAGVDPGRSFPVLDRLIRTHLAELADAPLSFGAWHRSAALGHVVVTTSRPTRSRASMTATKVAGLRYGTR